MAERSLIFAANWKMNLGPPRLAIRPEFLSLTLPVEGSEPLVLSSRRVPGRAFGIHAAVRRDIGRGPECPLGAEGSLYRRESRFPW